MLLSLLLATASLWGSLHAALPPRPVPAQANPVTAEAPRFDPATRAVSNWHEQAAESLRPRALALTASLSGDPPYVARCVRLNNGWCIKSARWPGEIGADGEGHTAFATLADGADAAARLLRRYYRDYGRRNALAIVRRWAPAECRVAASAGRTAVATPAVSAALAPRGIGKTLRARFLARHRPGGAPRVAVARRAPAGALRVQPWSPLARLSGRPRARIAAPKPVAAIAAGIAGGASAGLADFANAASLSGTPRSGAPQGPPEAGRSAPRGGGSIRPAGGR